MYQIKNQLGFPSFDYARDSIEAPFIIKALKAGMSGEEIYTKVGYSSSAAARSHNKFSQRLFFGMKTEEARIFFKNNPTVSNLRDAFKIFIFEKQSRHIQDESLAVIDKLALKYSSVDSAARSLNLFTHELIDQVSFYYKDWNQARREAVSKFLIEQLKSSNDFLAIFAAAGYSSPSTHNTYSQRLFKFSGMTVGLNSQQIHDFLRTRSWIITLEDFEKAYIGNSLSL